MKNNYYTTKSLILYVLILWVSNINSVIAQVKTSTKQPNNGEYGFIENKGQLMDQSGVKNTIVDFLLCSSNFNTQLRHNGFSYEVKEVIRDKELETYLQTNNDMRVLHKMRELDLQTKIKVHRIDIEFIGCNPSPEIISQNVSQDVINYYTSIVPNGVINVKHYKKITYKNIYPNIDVEYEISAGNRVKYNFIVNPNGNLSDIKLKYKGANDIKLSKNILSIKTSLGEIKDQIPNSFIKNSGVIKNVEVNFIQIEKEIYSFKTNANHANATLIIDPLPNIQWGSYYGGTSGDYAMGVTIDPFGNSTICGDARSITNIATVGAYQTIYAGGGDCFMAQFNAAGTRQWATYYGGSGWDGATAIASDATGNVYITAWITGNAVFASIGAHQPNYGGGPWDALVAKFSPTGARIWSTFYGGSGDDEGWGITVDNLNNVIIAGNTESANNISSLGAHQTLYGGGSDDAFVAKFDANGNRLWGTYYGGSGTETDWYKSGIVTDNANNVILATWSDSPNGTNIIASPGAYQTTLSGGIDAILVKFNAAGVRQWGTYYGGASTDVAYGVACDPFNNITFVGLTSSLSNIATAGSHQTALSGGQDAFVVKFSPVGTRIWGTYFGGPGNEEAYNIDNICSQFVVLGFTNSNTGVAVGNNLHQPSLGGQYDAFIAQFNDVNGTVTWSTYYGGAGNESAYWYECNISSNGSTGDFVITGNTTSNNSIAFGSSHQSTMSGLTNNAFIAKFDGLQSFSLTSTVSNINCFGGNTGSATVNIVGNATNPITYSWAPSGSNFSVSANLVAGNYSVIATDLYGCKGTTTLTVTQPTSAINATINSLSHITCYGANNGSLSAVASGGTPNYTYNWLPQNSTSSSITQLTPGLYSLTISDANQCSTTVTVNILEPEPMVLSVQNSTAVCQGSSTGTANVSVMGGNPAYNYTWSGSTGNSSFINGLQSGSHTITITDSKNCSISQNFSISVLDLPIVKAESESSICFGTNTGSASASITGGYPNYSVQWLPHGGSQFSANGLNAGTYTVIAVDKNGCAGKATVNILQYNTTNIDIISDKKEGCAPLCTEFSFNPTVQLKNFYWTSDKPGGIVNGNKFNYCLNKAGKASVFVTYVDMNNCTYTTSPFTIEAFAKPKADFHVSGNTITTNEEIQLQNTSSSSMGETYKWFFKGMLISSSNEKNPRLFYETAGSYPIALVVTNEKGCSDSIIKYISIDEEFQLYVPNAFTPNNDGLNDTFQPKGTGFINYNLMVFDRWGELLFNTDNIENAWDGTKKGIDEILKNDVYVWKIGITSLSRKYKTLTGTVSLLK